MMGDSYPDKGWAMPDGPRSHPIGRSLLRVSAAVAVSIAIAGCAEPDRGACLKSHHVGPWVQFIFAGKAMIPITHPARDVCDEWEFPKGREGAQ
jgi:hypothetical protein